MIIQKRFIKLPDSLIQIQMSDPLTRDLYLCELSELLIRRKTQWKQSTPLSDHLLVYCTKGDGLLNIAQEVVHFGQDQFCVIPQGFVFELNTGLSDPTVFLTIHFNGPKSKILEREFGAVRNLEPSITNRVANRRMLFDEIFNNLARGYSDANIHYINFTFSHLLATFVFASQTADDILIEEDPVIQKAIRFMELNIHKKMRLEDLSDEVGLSLTYLSVLFKRSTNYSPMSYFSHLKIVKACEYLDQTTLKIKEIAFLLGYTDAYYFSKDFQKRMGLSPRNYRKRVQG